MGCFSSKNHKQNKVSPVGAPNTKAAAPLTKVKQAWGATNTEDTSRPIIVDTPVDLFVKEQPGEQHNSSPKPMAHCHSTNMLAEDSGIGSLPDSSKQVVKVSLTCRVTVATFYFFLLIVFQICSQQYHYQQ